MHPVSGIQLGIDCSGIKVPGRKDLLLIKANKGSTMAGVFTQNAFCAAPVHICRQHLAEFDNQEDFYCLVNTGNANAGTGQLGFENAITCCETVASETGRDKCQIFPFSTGVIGEDLPVEKIVSGIPKALADLSGENWNNAAEAILTTDTVPKGASVQLELAGTTVTITGISKGSGMIRPDMATMLAYVTTDVAISSEQLQALLLEASERSFNRITVDGDTSTNDSCMLIATGTSCSYVDFTPAEKEQFQNALFKVFEDLAKAIVLDGEGATKLINIEVEQGKTEEECLQVAYTIAHSPLVKTAFFASDPNWGRILAAIGRSGIKDFSIDDISIFLDDVCIVRNGGKADSYQELDGQAVMDRDEITIHVQLARGEQSTQVWTCDFSYDYVKINAEYRT